MESEWYKMPKTEGPTLVYGAETGYSHGLPARRTSWTDQQVDVHIKPTSAACAWNCSNATVQLEPIGW